MKKIITLFILALSLNTTLFAQEDNNEESFPMYDAELVRKVLYLDIEGKSYTDVTVAIRAVSPDYFNAKYRVKVKVTDAPGNTVYNKIFKNAYLYVFSGGQVQVGRPKFRQLIIYDSKSFGKYEHGIIREKEGVY